MAGALVQMVLKRPLQLCSDGLYSIPNEHFHSCGLPVTRLLTRTLRLPWNLLQYSQDLLNECED